MLSVSGANGNPNYQSIQLKSYQRHSKDHQLNITKSFAWEQGKQKIKQFKHWFQLIIQLFLFKVDQQDFQLGAFARSQLPRSGLEDLISGGIILLKIA